MAYFSMLLQEDVNKLYPDILNHDIIPPPHWPGRVSHTFFLKRRPGFTSQISFGNNKVLDYLQFNDDEFGLVKNGDDVEFWKNDELLETKSYSASVNHKLFTVGGPSGDKLEEGTNASADSTGGVFKIIDSTKSWTDNEFALRWLYIYDSTVGTGQVLQIVSNTATELELYSGWTIKPTEINYKIFENYSECVAFTGDDGIYVHHNDDEIIKIKRFGVIKDVVYSLGRLFVVDWKDNIIVSDEGTGCYYYGQPIGTYSGVIGMTLFQDYILLLGKNRIGMIQKEIVALDQDMQSIETFKTLTISTTLGVFGNKSFTIYNQGLYVLTATKKLVGLSISPSGTDRFVLDEDDQGSYIQQFLDNILPGDDVQLAISSEKICLVHHSIHENNVFLYDLYYNFWYRRDTVLPIHGAVMFNHMYFLGDMVYKIDKELSMDLGVNDYKPKIKSILGEDDIFSLKTYMMHKMYIGIDTNPDTIIRYVSHIDGKKYETSTNLNNIQYLTDTMLYNTDGSWGRDMFGYGIFGGAGFRALDVLIGAINTIEIPISLTSSLTEIHIEGDIEFGGQMVQYEEYEPHITPINSVSGYNI